MDYPHLSKLVALMSEGDACFTLPFPGVSALASRIDCIYTTFGEEQKQHTYIRQGSVGSSISRKFFYWGETSDSSVSGSHQHYLERYLDHRLRESGLTYTWGVQTSMPLSEFLMRGSSSVVSNLHNDSLRTIWTKFITDYVFPFFAGIDRREFGAFLRILAIASGYPFQPFQLIAECRRVGLSAFSTKARINKALHKLVELGVWLFIEPFSCELASSTRGVVQKPIGMFFDVGFLSYLLGSDGSLGTKHGKQLFWHAVACDLTRVISRMPLGYEMRHWWRPPTDQSILVLSGENFCLPICVTATRPKLRSLRGSDSILTVTRSKPKDRLLIHPGKEFWNMQDDMLIVPFDLAVSKT